MTLSIELVDLIFLIVIKALERKILNVAVQDFRDWHVVLILFRRSLSRNSSNSSIFEIPYKMAMRQSIIMEERDEYFIIGNEAACHAWVWEVIIWHTVVIKSKLFVDLKFLFFDHFLGPGLLAESPEPEHPIVMVTHSEVIASEVLLHFFDFDICPNELLFKHQAVICQAIHLDVRSCPVLLGNSDGPCRVVGDDHRNYVVHSHNLCLLYHVLEHSLVRWKFVIPWDWVLFPLWVWVLYCAVVSLIHERNSWICISLFVWIIVSFVSSRIVLHFRLRWFILDKRCVSLHFLDRQLLCHHSLNIGEHRQLHTRHSWCLCFPLRVVHLQIPLFHQLLHALVLFLQLLVLFCVSLLFNSHLIDPFVQLRDLSFKHLILILQL